MTLIIDSRMGKRFDIISDIEIPRKKRFYVKDKNGYYYIPETIKTKN